MNINFNAKNKSLFDTKCLGRQTFGSQTPSHPPAPGVRGEELSPPAHRVRLHPGGTMRQVQRPVGLRVSRAVTAPTSPTHCYGLRLGHGRFPLCRGWSAGARRHRTRRCRPPLTLSLHGPDRGHGALHTSLQGPINMDPCVPRGHGAGAGAKRGRREATGKAQAGDGMGMGRRRAGHWVGVGLVGVKNA